MTDQAIVTGHPIRVVYRDGEIFIMPPDAGCKYPIDIIRIPPTVAETIESIYNIKD